MQSRVTARGLLGVFGRHFAEDAVATRAFGIPKDRFQGRRANRSGNAQLAGANEEGSPIYIVILRHAITGGNGRNGGYLVPCSDRKLRQKATRINVNGA